MGHLNEAMNLIIESQESLIDMNLIENQNNLEVDQMQNLLHQLNEVNNSLQNVMQVPLNPYVNLLKPCLTILFLQGLEESGAQFDDEDIWDMHLNTE